MESMHLDKSQEWSNTEREVVVVGDSNGNFESSITKQPTCASKYARSRGKPQSCPICGVIISNSYNFNCHVKRHRSDKPFKCNQCPASFILRNEIIKHEKIHLGQLNYTCSLCPKSFKTKCGKRIHEDTHGINEYKCRFCEEKFTKYIARSKHETRDHKQGELKCSYCYRVFVNKEFKKAHEENDHNKPKKTKPKEKAVSFYSSDNKSKDLSSNLTETKSKLPYFKCKLCPERFTFRKDQISHIYCKHPEDVDKLLQTCNICGKKFTGLYFNYHMKAHLGDKPHACTFCDFKAARKEELKTHMRCHNDDTPYQCSQCGKRFKCKKRLALCEGKHTGKKEIICNICERTFFNNSVLARHITKVHSKQKCEICGLELPYQHLKKHVKKVHSVDESVEVLICDICGKSFTKELNFKRHIKTHSQDAKKKSDEPLAKVLYYCPYCDNVSSTKAIMLQHCSSAHPTKIFQCMICPYVNLFKNKYEEHMQHHMKDNSYEIFFSFTFANSLKTEQTHFVEECFICGFQSKFEFKMEEHREKHEITFKKYGCLKKKYNKIEPKVARLKKKGNKIEPYKANQKRSRVNLKYKVNSECTLSNLDVSPDDRIVKLNSNRNSKKKSKLAAYNNNHFPIVHNSKYNFSCVKNEEYVDSDIEIKSELNESSFMLDDDNLDDDNLDDDALIENQIDEKNISLLSSEPPYAVSPSNLINNINLKDKLHTINGEQFISLKDLYHLRNSDINSFFQQMSPGKI